MAIVEFAGSGETAFFGALGVLSELEISAGYIGGIRLPRVGQRTLVPSGNEAPLELLVPAGAVVTRAIARIKADPAGSTNVGGIGTVRAAAGAADAASDSLIVDFGTLRSVSSVQAPSAIRSVTPWVGTKFDGARAFEGLQTLVDFTEIQTERLLVDVSSPITPAAFATQAGVTTSTPPADLELLVGGIRVFFRPGPAPVGFTEDVDVTAAVQAAVDAGGAPAADSNVVVRLALRARVAGVLGLQTAEDVRFLRTLTVDFPGPTMTSRFSEEGRDLVDLPLPAGSAAWTIHRVVATVAADDPGPLRVLPPVGPTRSTDADLVLDPDRRLVARLASGPLSRLETIAGVRVSLTPQIGGIELGGAVLGGTADEPGAPLPDATFTPVTVAGTDRVWVTLPLARPLAQRDDTTLWAALAVTRGKAVLDLADAAVVPTGDVSTLRRIGPNGIAHPPSSAVKHRPDPALPASTVRTDAVALRVVGVAPEDRPVAVVDVDLAGGPTLRQPGAADVISLSLDPAGPRSPLVLQVTTTAATTVTVGPVVVAYTEPARNEPGDPT